MEAGHRGCREGLRGHSGTDVMQQQGCLVLPWPATVKAGVCIICREEEQQNDIAPEVCKRSKGHSSKSR